VLTLVLVAIHEEKTTLRILVLDLVACVVLGVVLIPRFGVIGAALALLGTKLLDCALQYKRVTTLFRIRIGRLIWRPLLASACMAILLVALKESFVVVAVASAAALYVVVLLALAVWSAGGARQFRARYVYGWSE
jgi:O-antigen/teichoic acid export membrane protein